MTTNEAVVAMLVAFVQLERAMRDAVGKGGQQVSGYAPSITVSVLHELERIIRDAPDVAERYSTVIDDIARVTAERDTQQEMIADLQASLTNVVAERDALAKDRYHYKGRALTAEERAAFWSGLARQAESERDALAKQLESARENYHQMLDDAVAEWQSRALAAEEMLGDMTP